MLSEDRFCENLCRSEPVQKLVDKWKGVAITNRDGVEATIIDTHPKSTIFFSDKQNRSTSWGRRFADEAFRQVLVQKFSKCNSFRLTKRVDRAKRRLFSRFKFNRTIVGTMWRKLVENRLVENVCEVAILLRDFQKDRVMIFYRCRSE